jgi:hypothetical protein
MSFRAMRFGSLRQIRKPEAYKRFCTLQPIVVCPCNLRPGAPWYPEARIGPDSIRDRIETADWYGPAGITPNDQIWKGNVFDTAWQCFLNSVGAYMLGPEMGQYPTFWIDETEEPKKEV